MLNEGGVKFVIQNVADNSRAVSALAQCLGSWVGYLNLERHKWPGKGQIPAELVEVEGRTFSSEIIKLINSIWNEEELPEEWKKLAVITIYKENDKTDCSNSKGV